MSLPHTWKFESDGWVLRNETVTNRSEFANQMAASRYTEPAGSGVLLVGSSIRWAAQSAARAGYRVIGMDAFGDRDTWAACERFHQLTVEERSEPEKIEDRIGQLAAEERAKVFRVGGLRAASTASPPLPPGELRCLAERSGFEFPETCVLTQRHLLGSGHSLRSGRWLLKESDSTGGMGVKFFTSSQSIAPDAVLQKWIPGRALGLVALATHDGVRLLGMTRSIHTRLGERPFVYAGSRIIENPDSIPWSQMQTLAQRIAQQRGLAGLFNLDWICDWQNQWWLLEVNERPSASCELIERVAWDTGMLDASNSLMRIHIEAMDTHPVTPDPRFAIERPPSGRNGHRCTHLKRIVYSVRDGRCYLSVLPRRWRAEQEVEIRDETGMKFHVADRPAEGTIIRRGQPIATLLLSSPVRRCEIAQAMRAVVKAIQAAVKSR